MSGKDNVVRAWVAGEDIEACPACGSTTCENPSHVTGKPAKARKPRYVVEDYGAFRERVTALPAPGWLIGGLIPDEGRVLWHGAPRSMKTLSLEETALALACGRAPFGDGKRFPCGNAVRVGYVTEEDGERLTNYRFGLLEAGRHTTPEPGMLFPIIRRGVDLDDAVCREELLTDVLETQIQVLIFEPVRSLTALAEKTSAEFRPIDTWLTRLESATPCKTIVFGHHDVKRLRTGEDQRSKSEQASGSALFSKSGCLVSFEKLSWNRTLATPANYKDGATPPPFTITFETDAVETGDGQRFGSWLRPMAETTTAESATESAEAHAALEWIGAHPWCTTREIEEGTRAKKDGRTRRLLIALLTAGAVVQETGEAAALLGRSRKAVLLALPGTPIPGQEQGQ